MIYNLYCSKDRNNTHHSVTDDEEGKVQTRKCLLCGHSQKRVILERRVTIEKRIYDAFEKREKHAEQ